MGTPVYAAPEQTFLFSAAARTSRSPKLDLFSLGQLLFFALTGSDPLPLDTEKNAETLRSRLGAWPSGEAMAEAVSLYSEAAAVKPQDRIADIQDFAGRLQRIATRLARDPVADRLSLDDFARELAFACTGHYPTGAFDGSFRSASGQIQIKLAVRELNRSRYFASAHLTPDDNIGLQGLKGDEMRMRLNQRIDKALRLAKNVQRRSGTSGVYSVHIDIDRLSPDTFGVEYAQDAIGRAVRVLEAA
jgi:serine/threonine protein kinase